MRRRGLLKAGCAHCLGFGLGMVAAGAAAQTAGKSWTMPPRFEKPDLGSDEGGLWAMMDREEKKLRRSPFMVKDEALRDYLQQLAVKLAGEHGPDVRVYPVRTPFFNASMAPNGMMQVWTGLLLRVDNEAQLAAVLGHEIGHYLQRHTLERLRDAKARSAFGLFMAPFGVVGLVGQVAAIAGSFGFSRDQERDADQIGLQLMRNAGYDTREAAKIWKNLQQEVAAAHDGGQKPNLLFATHPGSDERSATLAALAGADAGGFVGEVELNERLAALQWTMLDDELRRGQTGETLVLLDRMIERAPQRSDLLFFRGEARRLRARGDDLDLALADFERALALGREPPQVHRALGYLFQGRQQADKAREAFARYVELAPEAADAAMVKSFL